MDDLRIRMDDLGIRFMDDLRIRFMDDLRIRS